MAGPAKSAKTAKVSSKNNPNTRGAQIKMYFQDKEVVPVKFIGSLVGKGVYIAIAQADSGDIMFDANGMPYNWSLAQTK
jgi:hypothetical protein